jgi:glutamate-ammonia-ligase adenylyltransferase
MRDRQVHELPAADDDRLRLALAMGYPDWATLRRDVDCHRAFVAARFGAIAFREQEISSDEELDYRLEKLAKDGAGADDWAAVIREAGAGESERYAAMLAGFVASAAVRRIDAVSADRLWAFLSRLVRWLAEVDAPAVALERTLAIIEQVLRRSAYIALLNENAAALRRLVDLCSKSAWLADQIARHPVLLDELLDPSIYTDRVSRRELEGELAGRLAALPETDSETCVEVLAQFQRASLFRIAVADFNGTLPIMRVSDCLTDLAETVLGQALHVAWQDMVDRHGTPGYTLDGQRYRAGFGILAYGKFGGIELSYTSDLDLVFLHDSQGSGQVTDGRRPLDNAVFFTRLVRRLVHFLTTQTGSGMLYEVDTRLRPDGRSGVLVTSLDAFERYQEENAWTWEHQALLRARPVAGSALIARQFERVRVDTLTHRVRRDALRADVVAMRRRMRDSLDKSNSAHFDLKQGKGGIGDIEFLVQYLVLANAGEHPAVIHYPDNIRQLGTLAASGCLDEAEANRLQDIYRAYRQRLHRLSLDGRPPLAEAEEFGAERTFVDALWERTFAG